MDASLTVTYRRSRAKRRPGAPEPAGRWWYSFFRDGVRHQDLCVYPAGHEREGEHAATRREAEDIETLALADVIAARPKRSAPEAYLFGRAVLAWQPVAGARDDWDNVQDYLIELLAFFKPETPIEAIQRPWIEAYVRFALAQPVRVWIGGPTHRIAQRKAAGLKLFKEVARKRSANTVNKYLSALSQVLARAHGTFHHLTRERLLPALPEIPFLKLPKTKPKPIPLGKLAEMYAGAPDHLKEVLTGVQLTQLRISELLRLGPEQLDEDYRGIRLGIDNKSDREDFIPLAASGFAFFQRLQARARAVGCDRLFLYYDMNRKGLSRKEGRGVWRPIKSITRAWRTRLRAAGLEGAYRFHQNKTTSLSALKRLGANPGTLQDMARHADFSTTRRHYLGEDMDARREAIGRYEAQLASLGMLPGAAAPASAVVALPDSENAAGPAGERTGDTELLARLAGAPAKPPAPAEAGAKRAAGSKR